jgi:hypothetical protein
MGNNYVYCAVCTLNAELEDITQKIKNYTQQKFLGNWVSRFHVTVPAAINRIILDENCCENHRISVFNTNLSEFSKVIGVDADSSTFSC